MNQDTSEIMVDEPESRLSTMKSARLMIAVRRVAWLTGLTLICSLTISRPDESLREDPISEIRAWAAEQDLWPELKRLEAPKNLIGVREVYAIERANLQLRAYVLIPCVQLCGEHTMCARRCQELIRDWRHSPLNARMVIEGVDIKSKRALGRVTLNTVAPIKLRYWSQRQGVIALTQSMRSGDVLLHLLRVSRLSSGFKGPAHVKQLKESTQALSYYDQLYLGSSDDAERSLNFIKFEDLDQDQRVELIAPLEGPLYLRPQAMIIPTPYRITAEGLALASDLLRVRAPSRAERRAWIVRHQAVSSSESLDQPAQSSQSSKPSQPLERSSSIESIFKSAEKLYRYAAQLCLKGECSRGDELIRFAYPQHEVLLRVWEQLKRSVLQARVTPREQIRSDQPRHPLSSPHRR